MIYCMLLSLFQQAEEENEQRKRQEQMLMEKLLEQEAMEQEDQKVNCAWCLFTCTILIFSWHRIEIKFVGFFLFVCFIVFSVLWYYGSFLKPVPFLHAFLFTCWTFVGTFMLNSLLIFFFLHESQLE